MKSARSVQDATRVSSEPPRDDDNETARRIDDEKPGVTRHQEPDRTQETSGTLTEPSRNMTAYHNDSHCTSEDLSTSLRHTSSLEGGTPTRISTPTTPPPSQLPTPPGSVDRSRALRRSKAIVFSWADPYKPSSNEMPSERAPASDFGEGGSGSKVRTWSERQEAIEQSQRGVAQPSPGKYHDIHLGSDEELVDPSPKRRRINRPAEKVGKRSSRSSWDHAPQQGLHHTPPSIRKSRRLHPHNPKRL